MIVQELRRIQAEQGYLPHEALEESSLRIGEPLHRLHEVASFFPHFKLAPPPKTEVHVCRDMACHLRGSEACKRTLERRAAELNAGTKSPTEQVVVHGVSCLGRCDEPIAVLIDDHTFAGMAPEQYAELMSQAHAGKHVHPPAPDRSPLPWKIDPYGGKPEYGAVRKFLNEWKEFQAANVEYRGKTPPELLGELYKLERNLKPDEEPSAAIKTLRQNPAARILAELKIADLRGMGGAGFPAGEKWKSVSQARLSEIDPEVLAKCRRDNLPIPVPKKYVVCNGDESEPGTFKDRELLLRFPHLVLEGVILGGLTTGASEGYVYIRHEYHDQIEAVDAAVRDAWAAGICGENIQGSGLSFDLKPAYVSPGGYICGEQNALLAAMEDRRAEPRNKPPSISEEGFRGQPTLLNNVETLSWTPSIYVNGGKWYAGQGIRGAKGLRFVSISGDVVKPGVYEVPFGQSVRELVMECAGGMKPGRTLKAIATSGPSSGFLPTRIEPKKISPRYADELVKRGIMKSADDALDILDMPMDLDTFKLGRGLMLGAAFIAYDDQANMLDQALNSVEFYRNESCGKCVPCRVGSEKMAYLLRQTLDRGVALDDDLVKELGSVMIDASICGLGQVVPNSILTVMKYFPEDIQRYVKIPGANDAG